MVRRICLYGGPGCGKSTTAARLFGDLKVAGLDVESVQEYIKTWAIEGRSPTSYDQLYVFGHQVHAEDLRLKHVSCVITDSPLLLNVAYAEMYDFEGHGELLRLANMFEARFPSFNIVLDASDIPYQTQGRYQDEYEAAECHRHIVNKVYDNLPHERIVPVKSTNYDRVLSHVRAALLATD